MEGGQSAATRLVRHGVTGIICASDVLALGAMKAARRLGLSVPADISVVGFDDSAFMNCTDPPLTTVRQPIDAMGQAAVALFASQVAGNVVPADEMLFEPELVVRGSTGPVRSRDSESRRSGPTAAKVSAAKVSAGARS
jgi:DNA-binding LacI/PurR family transcriptional regulator